MWNEAVGCGRPYRLEWESLLARTATDEEIIGAVEAAIRDSSTGDAEVLARAAVAAVLKELNKVKLG